jgi:hypothetical protein
VLTALTGGREATSNNSLTLGTTLATTLGGGRSKATQYMRRTFAPHKPLIQHASRGGAKF